MIDTHGLPMKFEFYYDHYSGRRSRYMVDFNACNKEGWPLLTNLPDGRASHPRPATDYEFYIRQGTWVITKILEGSVLTPVEDLL